MLHRPSYRVALYGKEKEKKREKREKEKEIALAAFPLG